MRQRITVENLAELSPEQQEKLKVWWGEHQQKGDVFICLGNDFLSGKEFAWDGHNKPFNLAIPLLSIGQILQLLDDLTEEPSLKNGNLRLSINRSMWLGNSRLVDSLFQAVKEIL